jgi:hypothetical protein
MGSQDRRLVGISRFIAVGHRFERLVIWSRRMDRHDRGHGLGAYFPVAISAASGSDIGCTCLDSRSDWHNDLILIPRLKVSLFRRFLQVDSVKRG